MPKHRKSIPPPLSPDPQPPAPGPLKLHPEVVASYPELAFQALLDKVRASPEMLAAARFQVSQPLLGRMQQVQQSLLDDSIPPGVRERYRRRRNRQLPPRVYQRYLRMRAVSDIGIDRANDAPTAQVVATKDLTVATDAQTAVLRQVLEQMAAPRPSEPAQLSQAPSPPESSKAPAQAEWRVPDRWRRWPQLVLIILDLRQAFPEHFGESPGAYPNLPASLKQMKRAKLLEGLRAKGLPEPADSTLRKLRKVDVGDGTA